LVINAKLDKDFIHTILFCSNWNIYTGSQIVEHRRPVVDCGHPAAQDLVGACFLDSEIGQVQQP
tara:strand:- start:128 stop:319 length:192 start_codon:yes stop_codon:yes gene_type:complete